MSDTYRQRVWQAIANSLNNATGHYGDVCDTVRDAVMAVRDDELERLRTTLALAESDVHDLLCWKEDMLRELASSPHDRPMAKAAREMGRQRAELRAAIESALTELRRGGQTDDIRRRATDAILGPLVQSWRETTE